MYLDIERLRKDLINYFGVATTSFPFAIMDVIEIEIADSDKLIEIATMNNFDLDSYVIERKGDGFAR